MDSVATKIAEVLESYRPYILDAAKAYQIIASKVISMWITAAAESIKANVNVAGEAVVEGVKGAVDVLDSAVKTGRDTIKGVAEALSNSETVQAIANSEQVKAITASLKEASDKAVLVAGNVLNAIASNSKQRLASFFGIGTNEKNALPSPSTYDQSEEASILSSELAAIQSQQGIGMNQLEIAYSFKGKKKSASKKKSALKNKSASKKKSVRKSPKKSRSKKKK